MIPEFDSNGNLPPGIHYATFDEFVAKFAYNPKRAWLIDGLKLLITTLRKANCSLIYVDGSFVTEKELPSDYDLCWSVNNVDFDELKELLDFSENGRKKMDMKYRGDIFPAEIPEGLSGKLFLNFFQEDKNTGAPKGIIAIELRS